MTSTPSTAALVFETSDGQLYAVPLAVVVTGRIPPEEAARLRAALERGDTQGFSLGGRALLPYVGADGAVYALTPETIARHRLTGEQAAAAHEALAGEVTGYGRPFAVPPGHAGGHPGRGPGIGPVFGDVTIINQFNIQAGINVAYNSPGAVLTLGQLGTNTVT